MPILDTLDVIRNLQTIHENDKAFQVLKDFERVIDNLGLYVFKNWDEGELVQGPDIARHWVKCCFMWPRDDMPDPMGAKILTDYGCKVQYEKSHIMKARKIVKPDDIRPGTKKGKLDKIPVWCVHINMPKSLILDVYSGDKNLYGEDEAIKDNETIAAQPAPEPVQPDPTAGAI